jgi:DNA-binding CsgD family transcriptional regulator/PAS domain-containing protein
MATAQGDLDTDAGAVLRQVVEATHLPVALADVPSRRLVAVSPALAALFPGVNLIGRDPTEFVAGGPSEALQLLTTGRVDGYELTRQLLLPGGVKDAYIWVHVAGDERPPCSAVVVVDTEAAHLAERIGRPVASSVTVIGTVDDEWRIDRLSADVQTLLGADPHSLYGLSILTLVHPGDLAEFLTGQAQAQVTGGGVSVRVRLRDREQNWRWCRLKVSPLGERAGFAFVLSPFVGEMFSHDRLRDLEQQLARIAHEVHSAGLIRGVDRLPAMVDLPELAKLTSREWQIVMRIQAGERIELIAASLHLSSSTVRNHLTAVYRKLGVHSQAELLVLLHRGVIAQGGDPLAST